MIGARNWVGFWANIGVCLWILVLLFIALSSNVPRRPKQRKPRKQKALLDELADRWKKQ